jgi:phage terminase large subunit-like protein
MSQSSAVKKEEALKRLNRLSDEERLAVLDAMTEKRKKKCFIKYFEPWTEQIEALKCFSNDIKIFGLLGGNRSGKSVLGAFLAVAWALGKEYFKDEPAWEFVKDLPIPPAPNNIWVVGLDFGVLRDVIWYEKLRHGKNHPAFLPDDGSIQKVSDGDFQVFFKNGSLITGKSADAGREKFQGASIDLVWIDEECEEDVFNECYQRTIDCGGRILLTLTPLNDINSGVRSPWVFDLYEDWLAGNKLYHFSQLSMLNSPFISDHEKELARIRWAGDAEEGARLYGQFVRKSGLVYPVWSKSVHVIKPFPIPNWWQRLVSIDPANTGVTAAIWIAIDELGNHFAYKEYYERERTISEHAKSIKIYCAGEPIDYWLLDPYWGRQRNGETHKSGEQLYRENGIPVRLPKFDDDEYPRHVSREYINSAATPNSRQPYFKVFEGLPNFEHEITHYTWDTYAKGEQKGMSKEKPRKRNDHLLNAMQYALTLRLKGSRKRSTDIFGNRERVDPIERVKLNSYT